MPDRCSSRASSSPAGPPPMMPTVVWRVRVTSRFLPHGAVLGRRGGRRRRGRRWRRRRWRPARRSRRPTGGGLPGSPRGEAVAEGGPQMHRQFVVMAAGHQRGEGDAAARPAGQAGAGPDLAPGVAGDEVLEDRGEGAGTGQRPVHVRVAEDGPAHGRARRVPGRSSESGTPGAGAAGPSSGCAARWPRRAASTGAGRSTLARWAAAEQFDQARVRDAVGEFAGVGGRGGRVVAARDDERGGGDPGQVGAQIVGGEGVAAGRVARGVDAVAQRVDQARRLPGSRRRPG